MVPPGYGKVAARVNHRRSTRVPISGSTVQAMIFDGESDATKFSRVKILNLSESGVAFEGCTDLQVGKRYRMNLSMPGGVQILGMASIAWRRSENYILNYGADFKVYSKPEEYLIHSYLRGRSSGVVLWILAHSGVLAVSAAAALAALVLKLYF